MFNEADVDKIKAEWRRIEIEYTSDARKKNIPDMGRNELALDWMYEY